MLHPRKVTSAISALLILPALAAAHGVVRDTGKVQHGAFIAEQRCAGCHGMDGIGVLRHDPNLAGQNFHYLVHELESFTNGKRPLDRADPQFAGAHQLAPDAIEAVSAYYASLKHRHNRASHRIAPQSPGGQDE